MAPKGKRAMKAAASPKAMKAMKSMKAAIADERHESIGPLGYLKYLQTAKKATEEQKDMASQAVALYKGLDPKNKKEFIQKFQTCKDDKSLTWVKDFSESLTKKQETTKKEHANHMTRHLHCTCTS